MKLIIFLKYTFLGTIIASIIILKNSYQFLNEIINHKRLDSKKCNIFTSIKNENFQINDKTYPNFVPIVYNKSIDFKCLNFNIINKSTKTILLWTKFNGLPLFSIETGYKKPFEQINCPVTSCELTNDRTKLNQSSLVLFHLRNKIDYFPLARPLNQRWVHLIYESPINCHLCDKYDNTFNLSATYTKDSDFTSIYWLDSGIYWQTNLNFTINNISGVYANRSEMVATLISSCNAPSSRSLYIRELQNHVAVRIFGKCGQPCPKDQDCREYISKNYRFFLLFENSICRDYITEKFFDTLKYNIIPIVLGGGDYSYYVPDSGFINVLDYKKPKDLADYLNYLNNNNTAYNEYFAWKKLVR